MALADRSCCARRLPIAVSAPSITSAWNSSATRSSTASSPAPSTRSLPRSRKANFPACAPAWCARKPWPKLTRGLGLGELLQLGEGELKSGGTGRPSILADALEAIFGAIYVDAGFDAVRAVIERLYQPALARIDPTDAGKDPKTALQEILQGRHLPLPRYTLLATSGEAHAQQFEIECVIAELGIRSTGTGSSRRIAEQQAAERAIAGIKA